LTPAETVARQKYDLIGSKRFKKISSRGLDPRVHVFKCRRRDKKTWMAGSSPAKGDVEAIQFK
jgi:hypothetical protein